MALSQRKAKRKPSGGRYVAYRKKRLNELGSVPTLTKMAERKQRAIRVLGGNVKYKLLSVDVANVIDPSTKKAKVVKIKSVTGNPANRHFIRRNIITKGTIIDTEIGKAKVTSRPGQEGTVNAVLVK